MTPSRDLGGGYAQALPDPAPTVAALLDAAVCGSPDAELVVVAGPPGVGKSTLAATLVELLSNTFVVDKDQAAAGFILQAARDRGVTASQAYGDAHYATQLRPLEYAGALALACANLVGTRRVLLVGGWGPELGVPRLWTELRARIAPARLTVLHLDAPGLPAWRARLAARGSRHHAAWVEQLARATGRLPVWAGAVRITTEASRHAVSQAALDVLTGRCPQPA